MVQAESQPINHTDISVINRADYAHLPLVDNPQTTEDAIEGYFRDVSRINNVVGIGFYNINSGFLLNVFERDMAFKDDGTDSVHQDQLDILEVTSYFCQRIKKITGNWFTVFYVGMGNLSFEDAIIKCTSSDDDTEEEIEEFLFGEGYPEGMTKEEIAVEVQDAITFFNNPYSEDPIYFKFD